MKKFLLLTYFLSLAVYIGYSQSLILFDSVAGQLVNLANNATVLKSGTTNTGEIIKYIGVKNNTSSSLNVLVKKNYINILPGTLNVFCWGLCFGPEVFVSPDPISIDPGIINVTDFSGHYDPYAVSGISTIRYTFWVDGNTNDSVCFNVNFAAYPLGLDDLNQKTSLPNAFPNPSNYVVSIEYILPSGSQSCQVIIRNILGVIVKQEPVIKTSGKVIFQVYDLSDGIYFYSLVVNGEIAITKKMVIKH